MGRRVAEALRYGTPLSLAMRRGLLQEDQRHLRPAGDEVPAPSPTSCRRVPQPPTPCRSAVKSSALIMPNTSPSDAARKSRDIREAVAELTFPRHPDYHVTISIESLARKRGAGELSAENASNRPTRRSTRRSGRAQLVLCTNVTPSEPDETRGLSRSRTPPVRTGSSHRRRSRPSPAPGCARRPDPPVRDVVPPHADHPAGTRRDSPSTDSSKARVNPRPSAAGS